MVVADFAEARVLDRLLMYERRIESSLYRTMAQLRNEREARAAATAEEGSRSQGGLTTGQESTTPAELASFGANRVPERASNAAKITPDGVTTSPAEEQPCETKPISGGVSERRCQEASESCEGKTISEGRTAGRFLG